MLCITYTPRGRGGADPGTPAPDQPWAVTLYRPGVLSALLRRHHYSNSSPLTCWLTLVLALLAAVAYDPGGTITGVQLAQARSATANMQAEPATSGWAAFVLVQPHCQQ